MIEAFGNAWCAASGVIDQILIFGWMTYAIALAIWQSFGYEIRVWSWQRKFRTMDPDEATALYERAKDGIITSRVGLRGDEPEDEGWVHGKRAVESLVKAAAIVHAYSISNVRTN